MSRKLTKIEKLSRKIARKLFTNAFGERAERITLFGKPVAHSDGVKSANLGGWRESSAAWEIEKHLIGKIK